jgi:hypothetical protein
MHEQRETEQKQKKTVVYERGTRSRVCDTRRVRRVSVYIDRVFFKSVSLVRTYF